VVKKLFRNAITALTAIDIVTYKC